MVAAYRPFLNRIGLTYTQYLVMMVKGLHTFTLDEAMELKRLLKKLHASLEYFDMEEADR